MLNGGEYKDAKILEEDITEEMLRFQYTVYNKPENIDLFTPNKTVEVWRKTQKPRLGIDY